jgi:acyl-CoA reductase-like NAD-dependent aldehyde dehydrogenase
LGKNNSFNTINPATGETLASYEFQTLDQARQAVERSSEVFKNQWSQLPIVARAGYFRSLASVLKNGKSEYARTISLEMGKPITQAYSEVEKCAWTAELFADKSEEWLADEKIETDARASYVSFEPLGVILSIMPWNFPFSQVFRFAIPALMAGNTTVLKHSRVCTGSALAIQQIFEKAGFPKGVFNTLLIGHDTVEALMADELVKGVSLTGSVEVGLAISEIAGRNMKKAVLELGGSDAFIVLDDADIMAAAKGAADARLLNSGQSCINGKRFIVQKAVARAFTEGFVEEMRKRKLGDPLDERTDIGPLATANQVDTLREQVHDAVSKAGRIEIEEEKIEGNGSYFSPTVISNARPSMRIMQEEVFGPVAPVCVVESEKEAIAVANNTEFGLGASLWTRDMEKAVRLTRTIEAGLIAINAPVRSDPRMPFGGTKKSGIGRETGRIGLREFVNAKSTKIY